MGRNPPVMLRMTLSSEREGSPMIQAQPYSTGAVTFSRRYT